MPAGTRAIVAIIDRVTGDLAGPITLHAHDAAAIRFFGDVASMDGTQVKQHILDHDLVELGVLDGDTLCITPTNRTIVTGAQWQAAQAIPELQHH